MFCYTGTTDCRDYEECNKLPDDVCSNPTYRRIAETSCRKFCKLCTGELNRPVHQCKRLYVIYLRCASAPTIFQPKKQSHNFPNYLFIKYLWMDEWINLSFQLKFHYSRTSPHQASGNRNHRGDDGPHQGSSVRVRDGGPDRPSHHRGRLHGAQSGGVRTAVIRGRIHANQTSGVCCHDNK